jgi:capsular polysaccharide biosynthesis protein
MVAAVSVLVLLVSGFYLSSLLPRQDLSGSTAVVAVAPRLNLGRVLPGPVLERFVSTYATIAASESIADHVASRTGIARDAVRSGTSVAAATGTGTITVTVELPTADQAETAARVLVNELRSAASDDPIVALTVVSTPQPLTRSPILARARDLAPWGVAVLLAGLTALCITRADRLLRSARRPRPRAARSAGASSATVLDVPTQ